MRIRLSKDRRFMNVAMTMAIDFPTCLRRGYAAIVVNDCDKIISTGYCGAPSGMPHCDICYRLDNNIPQGRNYDMCRSIHAEENALVQAGKLPKGCKMYIAGYDYQLDSITKSKPCYNCSKLLLNCGIETVILQNENGLLEYTTPLKLVEEWEKEIFK